MILSSINFRIIFFCLLSYAIFVSAGVSRAEDPLIGGTGSRPIALGTAYVGLADDGNSIFTNPAGLSELKFPTFASTYTKPLSDITFTSLSGIMPSFFDSKMAFAFRNRTIADIQVTTQESADYSDQDMTFSFAKIVSDNTECGANFRLITKGFNKIIPGFEGENGQGSTVDIGLKYLPYSWMKIGISSQSLLGKITYKNGNEETLSPSSTFGTAIILGGENGYFNSIRQDLLLTLDVNKKSNEPSFTMHSGMEWSPVKMFSLRLGIDQSLKSATEIYNNFTMGFGIKFSELILDYAFRRLGDPSQFTEHYFSIGYSGPVGSVGKPPKAYPYQTSNLLHFKDVPGNYWAKEPIEYLTTLGVMNWLPDGYFRPDNPISRAEVTMSLVKAKKYTLPEELKEVFSDVPINHWAAAYIQSAYENKLAYGYPDHLFLPRKATTRAEGIVFTSRFADLKLTINRVLRSPFSDVSQNHWGIYEVLAATDSHVIDHYTQEKDLHPSDAITRAELADMLYRTDYIKQIMKESFGKEVTFTNILNVPEIKPLRFRDRIKFFHK